MIQFENPEKVLEDMHNAGVLAKINHNFMVSNKFLKLWNSNFNRLEKLYPGISLNETLIPTLIEFAGNLTDKQKIEWYLVFEAISRKAVS